MAITGKERSTYTQKASVAGTERLIVSGTEYITPAQIIANTVKKTGDEIIQGQKTFDNIMVNGGYIDLDSVEDLNDGTPIGDKTLPSYSASDNGKVLTVVGGKPAWGKVASVYSGSAAPASTLGSDGDIYIQY